MSERQPTNSRTEVQGSVSGSSFLLQRACACGGSAGLDDRCEGCRQAKVTGQAAPIQPKLRIGPADDHYERQADRVADTVMRTPSAGPPGFSIERISPLVRRQPVEAEEEEAQTTRLQRQPIEEEEGELQPKRLQRQPVEEEKEEEMQMKRAPGGGGAAHSRLAGTHRGGGQPLPTTERTFFEPRLGFDFSDVRVHTNADAAASARAVAARAYTVGRDVVFGAGQWAPGTGTGRRLIAHELTHVVQQGRNKTRATSVPARLIQRDGGSGGGGTSTDDEYRLQWPGMQQSPFSRPSLAPRLELRIDPAIQAQIAAMRMMRDLLNPESIRSSLLRIDFDTLMATQPPPWLTAPTPRPTAPPVPQGAGPSSPRAGSGGDVLRAIMRIPSVDTALTRLRTQATGHLRRDWRRLSTGGRALLITQSALISGGVLAGVLSSAEGRDFSLGMIQNRDLPIPGVPGLTFQFNATGRNQFLRFDLNVGALLPSSFGFR